MVITICGDQSWLWRAVDNEGEVLDFPGPAPSQRQSRHKIDGQDVVGG
jgi:hypothetical protein